MQSTWFRKFGPGLLVTAAFIGPGTVTKATTAGANYGYALVWAIVFSVFATVVFQEMAARLGIVTKAGLGEAIRQTITNPVIRFLSLSLVVTAIVVGNAAYQAGNIAGAATGLATLTDEVPPTLLGRVCRFDAGTLSPVTERAHRTGCCHELRFPRHGNCGSS